MNVVVLGTGSALLADDGAGILTVRMLRELIADIRVSCGTGGADCLDVLCRLSGFDRAVIVDTASTGTCPPGTLSQFRLREPYDTARLPCRHTAGLGAALAAGSLAGVPVPEEVTVIAVEVADTTSVCEQCTPAVRAAIPQAMRAVFSGLRRTMPDLGLVAVRPGEIPDLFLAGPDAHCADGPDFCPPGSILRESP